MAKIHDNTRVSTDLRVTDWKAKRKKLVDTIEDFNASEQDWLWAINQFTERVETRFLRPLKLIADQGRNKGEGFTIMAICCALLEHFASFYQGKIYRVKSENNANLLPFEYSSSADLITRFLTSQEPFRHYFTSNTKASEFFKSVRCGLLHEMRTKEDWVIRTGRSAVIYEKSDQGENVVYRKAFLAALISWLDTYKEQLITDSNLRLSFLRKMDDLTGVNHEVYFAYGSNMDVTQLKGRLPGSFIHKLGLVSLEGYEIVFNKLSTIDGTGKANIRPCPGAICYGVLYEIDREGIQELKRFEKGYELKKVNISTLPTDRTHSVDTFIAPASHPEILPSEVYKEKVFNAMQKEKLPAEYIQKQQNRLNSLQKLSNI